MQKKLNNAFAYSLVLFLSACGYNGISELRTEAGTGHHHTEKVQAQAAPGGSPVLKNDRLNAVYQQYIKLTAALVNSDVVEAKIAANAIKAGSTYITGASGIRSAAEKIIAAGDIEKQRTSYSGLSGYMAELIEKEGLTGGELYIAYCPMALSDKGGMWISKSREIRNPYFGETMLGCGEVQRTIR